MSIQNTNAKASTSHPFDLDRFKQQLGETIAWCNAHATTDDVEHSLRSSVPTMPDTLDRREIRQKESPMAGLLRRQRGYDTFFAARAERVKNEGISVSSVPPHLADGRLLVFDINWCGYEGAMGIESEGFFDGEQDGPPWDTWVYYDSREELLICWIPPEFIRYAEAGMEVMTLEWNRWLTGDEHYDFVKVLKQEGLFTSLEK